MRITVSAERRTVRFSGVVQGVGFRPFVYRVARKAGLAGSVRNDGAGVIVDVEGERRTVDDFIEEITGRAPPLARIEETRVEVAPVVGLGLFSIDASEVSSRCTAFVSPDVATCDACLAELADPADRRHHYPFLNCTDCGPRLSITRRLPYDRPHTSMAAFPLCRNCAAEYADPADRRFHAQPTACPECGPRLLWRDARGGELCNGEPLQAAVDALLREKIVAVKGLGGFHLACDATDEGAVARLRRRKRRPRKPLAVMVPDLPAARELCRLEDREAELLSSYRRPIVLLEKIGAGGVAPSVAPDNRWLGVMLPYAPLHHLLLAAVGRPLVMTSGNVSGEPIVRRSSGAAEALGGSADFILDHDRPIVTRCDDSVARVVDGRVSLLRRSRGYAPEPVKLPAESSVPLVAVGGQLKNVFCLVRRRFAFLSHHVGDLESEAAFRAFREGIEHYEGLFGVRAEAVVHDLHPGYLSTRHARALAVSRGIATLGVQHHHAHVAGCAAENGFERPVIGVAFDGTGYGPDGTIWGGEFLVGDLRRFHRAARLRPVRLPGGEAAIREPWRVAAACLWDLGEEGEADPFVKSLDPGDWKVVRQMLERGFNAPLASSAGRLFDAVAALAGLRGRVSYEGEAAVGLESVLDEWASGAYPLPVRAEGEPWEVDTRPLVQAVAEDAAAGVEPSTISARFHRALVEAVVEVCSRLRERTGVEVVALSGGVFQNAWLARRTPRALEDAGFRPLIHRQVPCNDGGLAYGQAVVAAARLRDGVDATDDRQGGGLTVPQPREGLGVPESPEELAGPAARDEEIGVDGAAEVRPCV